ncbi:MAG: hypothetical protein H0U18_02115 [Pyrinomonadaceae bacterium]|nr:hypothetical protein [Pyrinomonadaceae bacterium]
MTSDDAILSATVVYSEEEVLTEFWECCEAEAETPREQLRSGTWSTIRKARKARKQVTIVWPDGKVTASLDNA